ncbi:probable ADP-ribosylation factor GTPase-activating protein AGD14 isoform X2 [Miscanthus floridulus]|uniref:probable ADP-ribosylation factor GTPase-activating protein AGD14 isoform X2 n=1 Tax=Miscanthus floridulus TaxID=154761 RepID=UPI0034581C14
MGSRVKEDERNEKIIRGLLKLPGNRRCINCNSLGPQYVCTSFSTFICTNCSGIHREFSHRVKSVSMAKFTSQEVSALQEGGNERAKEIYFKHWDLQGPVIDSSDVHRLRNFIKNVYVERRYSNQRNGEHLPQAKGNQDSYGNSNADSSRGVLRSAYVGTYEDNHDLKRTTESLSENQNKSNVHPVGTVDQNNSSTMAREKVDLRSHLHPDDPLKTDGKSENNQKIVIPSASSAVQASKEANSKKAVLPIKLPDPPRSQKATASNTSTEAQKSSSSRTDDPSPATLKDAKNYMSKNLIDFDSELEPPQGVAQTDMQKGSLPATDVGWATFDDVAPRKTTTMLSTSSTNSVEGPTLQIPNLASASQIRFSNAKSLSFSPANHGTQLNQHNFSPVNTIQYNDTLLNRATSAPVHSQLWRAASPTLTTQWGSILPANQGSNILIGTHDPAIVSASQQPAAEATSNGRKALPEDIFTMSYRPVSSAWNWQQNPRVHMQYGQYRMHNPVGIVNLPSLTSMQEALPNLGSTLLLSRAPDHQYMVQQHAVQVQNNTFPTGGIATTANAYGLPPMDQRLAAQNIQAMNQSSLPRVGTNPFA